MPKVKVLRSFNKTPQGDLASVSDVIEVEESRAGELVRLGLAEAATGAKAAEKPVEAAPAPAAVKAPVRPARATSAKSGAKSTTPTKRAASRK